MTAVTAVTAVTAYVPLQLRDLDTPLLVEESRRVSPLGIRELRAPDDDEGRLSVGRHRVLHDDVDAGAEAEDEAGVRAVEDQVAAGEEHLARGGDGGAVALGGGGHGGGG